MNDEPARSTILGVILAGGQSRRMSGADKALMTLDGRMLLAHVRDRLEPQVARLVLSANGDTERFAPFGMPVQPDTVPGHAGPLAGILAGMRWAQENAPDLRFVATAATDTPFFPADYVARLAEASALAADTIAIAATNGRRHPVFGLWPVSIADGLQTFLVSGETRRVTRFIEQHRCVEIDFGHREGPDPFFNINTPDDLETAERHAAASASTR
ncbi:MAG: molybdenum cofactor guanylyltransferase MobA [Nitratireductor sp.]|nr:molybdenum cofactor guanylyltransferase MobA [Nitratireductor sp.]